MAEQSAEYSTGGTRSNDAREQFLGGQRLSDGNRSLSDIFTAIAPSSRSATLNDVFFNTPQDIVNKPLKDLKLKYDSKSKNDRVKTKLSDQGLVAIGYFLPYIWWNIERSDFPSKWGQTDRSATPKTVSAMPSVREQFLDAQNRFEGSTLQNIYLTTPGTDIHLSDLMGDIPVSIKQTTISEMLDTVRDQTPIDPQISSKAAIYKSYFRPEVWQYIITKYPTSPWFTSFVSSSFEDVEPDSPYESGYSTIGDPTATSTPAATTQRPKRKLPAIPEPESIGISYLFEEPAGNRLPEDSQIYYSEDLYPSVLPINLPDIESSKEKRKRKSVSFRVPKQLPESTVALSKLLQEVERQPVGLTSIMKAGEAAQKELSADLSSGPFAGPFKKIKKPKATGVSIKSKPYRLPVSTKVKTSYPAPQKAVLPQLLVRPTQGPIRPKEPPVVKRVQTSQPTPQKAVLPQLEDIAVAKFQPVTSATPSPSVPNIRAAKPSKQMIKSQHKKLMRQQKSSQLLRRITPRKKGVVSKGAIKRIARRSGVKRLSSNIVNDSTSALKSFMTQVIKDAILYTELGKRKTVTNTDILMALKRNSATLYQ